MKRIAVIGSGVVGSATGKGFLQKGHEVIFYDVREDAIRHLREQGLDARYMKDLDGEKSDIFFFVVPTPTEKGKINLKYLKNAVRFLAKKLKKRKEYFVVVVRSTVPPRTTEDIVLPILETVTGKKAGKDFGLAMNPEYLREVSAESDFAHPWVLTLGSYDEKTKQFLDEIFLNYSCPVHHVSVREAEMQKYVHNLFNAVKIAFFNEMRLVAKEIDINPDIIFAITTESAEGIWNAKYGTKNLGPFDGMCLPKDTQAFFDWAKKRGIHMDLLGSSIRANKKFEEFWKYDTK